MKFGNTLHRIAAVLAVLLAGTAGLQAQPQEQGATRFARIARDGVQIRNLADPNGVSIAAPEKDSLVTIHGESAGWYAVEIPGGYAVWVYGRYVRPFDESDVYEVTRNGVNIRPNPSSDILSFPLPQCLHAGDRARMIEILEPEADLASTWVRIWSPPGVRAWVRASDTAPLASGEDGQVLWAQAMDALSERVVPPYEKSGVEPETQPTETVAEKPAESEAEKEARDAIKDARGMLEVEIEKETPDLASVRAKLEALLESAPSGAIVAEVRAELDRLALFEEVARVRADLERERARRAEEARLRQREAWEASVAKDPLGHVFLSRGVLYHEIEANGTPRFYLRFGRERVAELVCSSGRYDLDAFTGYEIGVQGELLPGTEDLLANEPGIIQVRRLEIIARR